MSAPSEAEATIAVDAAARKAWEDYRQEKRAHGGGYVPPPFDELDKPAQRNLREQVLPIVWAALEAIARPRDIIRAAGILEAADLVAAKDHRTDLGDDPHSTGWRHALNEVEHDLRLHAEAVLDEAEGIRR